MSLTDRERRILQLASKGLSDYKIARELGCDPPNINRAKKNGLKKLQQAVADLTWAEQIGVFQFLHGKMPNIVRHASHSGKHGVYVTPSYFCPQCGSEIPYTDKLPYGSYPAPSNDEPLRHEG